MAVGALYQRLARLTFLVPTPTAGDYHTTVATQLTINGSTDPTSEGMRVKFSIHKHLEKTPNTNTIVISNLSETTQQLLQTKGVVVLLEAGYAGTGLTGIFSGNARTIDHAKENATWLTTITCGDGDSGYRFARVNESFGPGTTVGQALLAVANATGLQMGNVPQVAPTLTKVFTHGFTACGSAQRAMTRLLKQVGYSWSIQDFAIQVLGPGQVLTTSIPLISPSTGLIESAQMGTPEKQGQPALCVFKSLLIPVKVGATVHLTDDRYDTDVKVIKADFEGDTHGEEWFTKIYGQLLSAAP